MKLIVALGNPGEKYAKTRHNVGFMAMDFFIKNCDSQIFNAQSREFSLNAKFEAEILKWQGVIFAKPQTFMNASGIAIKRIADFYKISEIAVLHDDLDLNLGAVKFKFGGGNAGHNGLKSIDSLLGVDYLRIRIGIGKPQNKAPKSQNLAESQNLQTSISQNSQNLVQNLTENSQNLAQNLACESHNLAQNLAQISIIDFVLSEFSEGEMQILRNLFPHIAQSISAFINGANLQTLQNAYTKKN